jgi:hypothetical protein
MLNVLKRFRRARAVVATLALASTEACYAYRPLAGPAPRVGERVRVVLTPEGTTELARYLGPSVAVAEGGLESVGDDGTFALAVDFVQMMNGIRQPWTGEGMVSIPSAYRSEVQQRVFLKRQSIVAGTVLAAGLVAIAVIALRAGGAQGGEGGNGGQPPP